jgi:hypothetical protein
VPAADFRPTVRDIGARLGGRTLTEQGDRIGEFNAETFPTAQSVDSIIGDALNIVASAIGEELEEKFWDMAKAAVISYACMEIEAGYYPETTSQADSSYASFRTRFQDQITYIEKALDERRPDENRIVSVRQYSRVHGGVGGRLDPWANEMLP